MAGAPRTASRRMASATVSTSGQSSHTSSAGKPRLVEQREPAVGVADGREGRCGGHRRRTIRAD
jgi:hypothetical protein